MMKEIFKKDYNNNKKYFFTIVNKYKSSKAIPSYLNIFSGRQVLEEIVLECKNNKLLNKMNNDFLCQKIDDLIKKDYLTDKQQKNNLNFIKEKIFEKNSDLVITLSTEVKASFCIKRYFDKLIDKMNLLLNDDDSNNSEDIKIIIDNIYTELFNKGYSIKQISEKIFSLFSTASYNEKDVMKIPRTSFPIHLIQEISDPIRLTELINNLSFSERISFIKKFYVVKKAMYYLIVPINGIVISNNIVKCNKDISIYNPKSSDPFSIKDENCNFREDEFEVDYKNSANICVKITALNKEAAYKIGMKKIDNYINILKLLSPENNLAIVDNSKLLLNEKGIVVAFSSCSYSNDYGKREFERKIHPLNEEDIFNDENVKKINKQIVNMVRIDDDAQNNTQIILLNAIKKYSEGLESKNEQEAILKFWSSMESLFDNNFKINGKYSKFETIQEVLSVYMTYAYKYAPLHELFYDLASATNFYHSNPKHRNDHSILNFPGNLLKKINLYTISTKSVSLLPLIKYNREIQKYLNDYYYLEKVVFVDRYYNDYNYSAKIIKEKYREYKSDLIVIYRLRNQIIHNAVSNDITTIFYLPLLRKITSFFLNEVFEEYINNKSSTINEIILKIYSNSILYIKNAEKCPLITLLF